MQGTTRGSVWLTGLALIGLAVFGRTGAGVEPFGPPPGPRLALAPEADPLTVVPVPGSAPPPADATHRYVGAASCSASNCHGGDVKGGNPKRSEFTIWMRQAKPGSGVKADPHRDAFLVLYNAQSQRIAKNLNLPDAHNQKVCLDCHAVSLHVHGAAPNYEPELADGVSCEGCHGPAEHWLGKHVEYTWKGRTPAEKADYGFVDTKDLLSRARMCAECHVGSKLRDVNHDIMAAGHPRLNHELAADMANLPAHWSQLEERMRHPAGNTGKSDYEAKLWVLGQVVAAEKAAELTAARAGDQPSQSGGERVWPEFTEYGCFSCHHDLASPSWRRERGYVGRKPVSYLWGTWQFAVLPTVGAELGAPVLGTDDGPVAVLTQTMNSLNPDRTKAAAEALALHAQLVELADRLGRSDFEPEQLQALLTKVSTAGPQLAPREYDSALQVYLALAALNVGVAERRDGVRRTAGASEAEVRDALKAMRESLKYPAGVDSPRGFSEADLKNIQRQLDRIHQDQARGDAR